MRELIIDNKHISTPLIDIIKDIRFKLTNGKLRQVKVMGDNIRLSCPHHKDGLEKNADCDVYIGDTKYNQQGGVIVSYGYAKCFACDFQGPFEKFVAECFDESITWAKKWLVANYADDILEDDSKPLILPDLIDEKPEEEFLDESILTTFEPYHPYMQKRKLDKHILEVFEVKYDPATESLVFPVRDEHGRLKMLTRRSVNSKVFIIDKDKEKPLYLMYYILQHNIQKAMICESQVDSLTACGFGFPCIATMGSISDQQIETLNKSGIRILYLAFDNDDAGRRFTNKVLSKLSKSILPIVVQFPAGVKDINDMTEDQFWTSVENAENSSIL